MLGDVDFMYLNENKFTGSISEELAGLLDADDLFLFGNQLTGKCLSYPWMTLLGARIDSHFVLYLLRCAKEQFLQVLEDLLIL